MGVSYWGYAWTDNEGWEQMPEDYKDELNKWWDLIRDDATGKFWFSGILGSPASPLVMGHMVNDQWKGGDGLHFQCVSVDDSGYGGEYSNPKAVEEHYDNLRWKTYLEARREYENILENTDGTR